MQRVTQTSVIVLVSLALSSWGSLAMALCPYGEGSSEPSATTTAKAASACHQTESAEEDRGESADSSESLRSGNWPCWHCMGRAESLKKPEHSTLLAQSTKETQIVEPFRHSLQDFSLSRGRAVIARLGAPPGLGTRTHLINSVFLI